VAAIRLADRGLHRRILLSPELALGEAYMDGRLTFEEGTTLRDFLTLLFVNPGAPEYLEGLRRGLVAGWDRLISWLPGFAIGAARRDVAHHYDLSRQLFELFLDEDLFYSCACFETGTESLEQAQRRKCALITRKLCLRPGQRVLDIGSGWGGLALYLARHAGVDVTGVTLSVEQLQVATERAAAAGLADRVRFHLMDYREVNGCFDRIVSVGMFEHVGVRHYDRFFSVVGRHLADDGVALLHSIGRSDPPGGASPWLNKYIFPNGYSPSLSEVLAATERQHLWVTDVEILRLHYARTLAEWQRRFQANRDRVRALYDERFCRMWELYLLSCELVFRRCSGMVFQMQLARNRDAVPLTRTYLWSEPEPFSRQELMTAGRFPTSDPDYADPGYKGGPSPEQGQRYPLSPVNTLPAESPPPAPPSC
jgi:cyclopropane-fatty-acyl-phospholipid synthase